MGNRVRQTLRQAGQPDQSTDHLLDLSGDSFQILAETSGTDATCYMLGPDMMGRQ